MQYIDLFRAAHQEFKYMADPAFAGFFISGLFWATEQIWKKGSEKLWDKGSEAVVDAVLSPGNEGLKERFKNWAGQGQESQRRKAFVEAVTRARTITTRQADDPQEAERILKILDDKLDRQVAQTFAEEATKIMLFSATPDLHRLQVLCEQRLYWETLESYESPLSSSAVAQTLYDFLTNLKETLLDEEPYQNLIQKEILRTLREVVLELRPVGYDNEETYRSQLVSMYRELEFVGIPELKERRPLTIEDVFIRLRTERKPVASTATDDGWLLEEKNRREFLGERHREEATLNQMLSSALRMVVLGDPGAGKTTLLKFLTVVCADKRSEAEVGLKPVHGNAPLPIFISLRAFAGEATKRDEDYSLLNYFYTHAKEHLLLNLQPGFFEEALEQGRCLVCLDGLDEIWAVGNRTKVRDAVKALASRFKHNRFLVTSRIVGYEEAPLDTREFVHHTVLPLTDEDIRNFVTLWYKLRERDPVKRQEQINKLIETIEREERIKTLAQNPLLLTIIALVHRIEAELPQERVKLYDKCVTALVDTWEEVKGLTITEKQRPFYKHRRRLLERLAYELHTHTEEPGQVRSIKEGDLELWITRFLMEMKSLGLVDDPDAARNEAEAFVHLVRCRTGLLIEKGEGVFGFPHLTFQEYLTACDIQNRCIVKGVDAIWNEIKNNLHDPHWREVILLLLGSLNRYDEFPTLLVERILEAGQHDRFEPLLHRCLYFAARALGDRVGVDVGLYRRIVDELLEIACDVPIWAADDAWDALTSLAQDQRIVTEIQTLAHDEQAHIWIRCAAAYSMKELGQPEITIAVFKSLAQDKQVDAFIRRTVAYHLGLLTHTEVAIEVLRSIVQDTQVGVQIRRNAINSLTELKPIGIVIEVLRSIVQDTEIEIWMRRVAAFGLCNLEPTEIVIEVLKSLAQDPQLYAGVQRIAASRLGELGQLEIAIEVLKSLARDAQVSNMVRCSAAYDLGELGQLEIAIEVLKSLAQDAQVEVEVRRTAAYNLGSLGQLEIAIEVLKSLAQDAQVEVEVRRTAAYNLESLGQLEVAVGILVEILGSENCKLEDLPTYFDAYSDLKSLIQQERRFDCATTPP